MSKTPNHDIIKFNKVAIYHGLHQKAQEGEPVLFLYSKNVVYCR